MAFFAACREAAPPDRRRNCLNTVRLFAALSVTYGHVVRHLQISIPPLRLFGLRIDVQAALTAVHNCVWSVPLFFFLSGFLLWTYGIKADLTLWQYPLVGSVLFCAASVGFAYGLPGLDLKTDISYGVYIYHMIIVNGMLELGFLHSGWSMLTAFVLSIAAGIVSTLTVGRIGKRRKAPVSPDPGTKGKEG